LLQGQPLLLLLLLLLWWWWWWWWVVVILVGLLEQMLQTCESNRADAHHASVGRGRGNVHHQVELHNNEWSRV
jgi:hypothetical protein